MERITVAVWEWLKNCPFIADIYLLFGDAASGAAVLSPLGETETSFIDGSKLYRYCCRVTLFESLCPAPNEDASGGGFERASSIAGWIGDMALAGSFPALPADCHAQRLYVLPEGERVEVSENGLAQYRLDFAIEYIIERGDGYGSMV